MNLCYLWNKMQWTTINNMVLKMEVKLWFLIRLKKLLQNS